MAFFNQSIPKEIILKIQGYFETNLDWLNFRKTCRKIHDTYDYHELMERVQRDTIFGQVDEMADKFMRRLIYSFGGLDDQFIQREMKRIFISTIKMKRKPSKKIKGIPLSDLREFIAQHQFEF